MGPLVGSVWIEASRVMAVLPAAGPPVRIAAGARDGS
jgi:hypothetical protein